MSAGLRARLLKMAGAFEYHGSPRSLEFAKELREIVAVLPDLGAALQQFRNRPAEKSATHYAAFPVNQLLIVVEAAAALDGQGDAAALPQQEKGQPVKYETHRLAVRKLEQMHADIEKAWQMLQNCYDVEPREYFEREARRNGFDSPLAQAIFHVHKRDKREAAGDAAPRVAASQQEKQLGRTSH